MKRRILSSLMALVLVFGLLPVSAIAASSTDLDADVPELARLGDPIFKDVRRSKMNKAE